MAADAETYSQMLGGEKREVDFQESVIEDIRRSKLNRADRDS